MIEVGSFTSLNAVPAADQPIPGIPGTDPNNSNNMDNMAGEFQVLIPPLSGRSQVPAFQECNHILFSLHLA